MKSISNNLSVNLSSLFGQGRGLCGGSTGKARGLWRADGRIGRV